QLVFHLDLRQLLARATAAGSDEMFELEQGQSQLFAAANSLIGNRLSRSQRITLRIHVNPADDKCSDFWASALLMIQGWRASSIRFLVDCASPGSSSLAQLAARRGRHARRPHGRCGQENWMMDSMECISVR